jgi:CAAX protease family protein
MMASPTRQPVRSIVMYFLIAYSIAWTAWLTMFVGHFSPFARPGTLLYLAAVFAPHASAVLCTVAQRGREGLRAFYGQVFRRVPFRWGIVAIFVPPLVYLASDVIAVSLHQPHGAIFHPPPRTLATLVLGQSAVVLGEEPGWRGFALPRLIERLGPNGGTLMLGVGWALWHLPLFAIPGTAQYHTPLLPFVITVTAWSMVITFLVLQSRSVIAAMLFHASANVCDFTMWQPAGYLFGLGPWVVAAGIAGWRLRFRRAGYE